MSARDSVLSSALTLFLCSPVLPLPVGEVNKVVRQIVCHGNCMAVVYLQAIHIFSM